MTPTQTLTLIAEEIEAGAEALYYATFGESAMKWAVLGDDYTTDFRRRSAAVLAAAGAVRKAAIPVVTAAMVNAARNVAIDDCMSLNYILQRGLYAVGAQQPKEDAIYLMRAALTAALTEPTP